MGLILLLFMLPFALLGAGLGLFVMRSNAGRGWKVLVGIVTLPCGIVVAGTVALVLLIIIIAIGVGISESLPGL